MGVSFKKAVTTVGVGAVGYDFEGIALDINADSFVFKIRRNSLSTPVTKNNFHPFFRSPGDPLSLLAAPAFRGF
jgi:hypothetical protein